MISSLFNRFSSKPSSPPSKISETPDKSYFVTIAELMGGKSLLDFKLYHLGGHTLIDLLLFVPERGLFLGETLSWSYDDLKEATISRASKTSKQTSTTRFESTHSKIFQKLQDVLSFDSTVCERFIWMNRLSEEEYDQLDLSFHTLLPRDRIVFMDESSQSTVEKLSALSDIQAEPYSELKVLGSLNAHQLLLPKNGNPFGSFMASEQIEVLLKPLDLPVTIILGEYKSGKSTLLVRKVVLAMLENPQLKTVIITPTRLSGELLRNELIALLEYAVIELDLSRITFSIPSDITAALTEESSDVIRFCDDAHAMENSFIESLISAGNRIPLFLTAHIQYSSWTPTFTLMNTYQDEITLRTLACTEEKLVINVIHELRKRIAEPHGEEIIVVLPDESLIDQLKPLIDKYVQKNCSIINKDFSLQYEDLDNVILCTVHMLYGLSVRHLILVIPQTLTDYRFALSRASESATIISYSDNSGETHEESNEK